jgi:transposase
VEEKSEAYRTKELEKHIKELEAALGRKQLEMDLLNKIIELANEEYGTDLKKNLSNRHSNGTGSIEESNTGTK